MIGPLDLKFCSKCIFVSWLVILANYYFLVVLLQWGNTRFCLCVLFELSAQDSLYPVIEFEKQENPLIIVLVQYEWKPKK